MATETELKLRIDPAVIEQLQQHELVQAASDTQKEQRLLGTYYDTPKYELLAAKIGLRVRRENDAWIQAVKTAGKGVGGLHQRKEWEAQVSSEQPELAHVPETIRDKVFKKTNLWEKIQPVFTSDMRRTTWQLQGKNGSHIELCLDQGEMRTAQSNTPISEIELELKQGNTEDLFYVALSLLEQVPLVLENASKAQRGYRLHQSATQIRPLASQAWQPQKARLKSDMDVETAMIYLFELYLNSLQRNEIATREQDAQGLLKMLETIRNLQTVISLFKSILPKKIRQELSKPLAWLQNQLTPAEDWTLLHKALLQIPQQMRKDDYIQELLEITISRQDVHLERIAGLLDSPRYTRLLLQLSNILLTKSWRKYGNNKQQRLLSHTLLRFASNRLQRRHLKIMSEQPMNTLQQQWLWKQCQKQWRALSLLSNLYTGSKNYLNFLYLLAEELGEPEKRKKLQQQQAETQLDSEHPAIAFLHGWYSAQAAGQGVVVKPLWQLFCCKKPVWPVYR
ncbi:CYTH and CHAD domain-containing protein [Candidatus Venteria ishoeyi]|uniref:CYTH domain protein n=3 Tax=Candidatus Venteria ishoeyi TaxID=1899563 RepID=A0A1H6FB69_9GAMM|nr:CYTH and CHAD domain-containing protein [Candidatus Venteria ishoeyi]SEH07328.1 CYTH domain protein [Candidatus Venteria ishoeyi]